MAIEFQCDHCSTTLRVPEEHAGKKAKCPKCQAVNLIQAGTILAPSTANPSSVPKPSKPEMGTFFNEGSPAAAGAIGNPASPYTPSTVSPLGGNYRQNHRGSTVLTLGIFALVCNMMMVPGVMAWIMGRADIKEMDAGRMDPEGRGMTQAGLVMGIIGTVISILAIVFSVIYFVVMIVILAGVAGAAR